MRVIAAIANLDHGKRHYVRFVIPKVPTIITDFAMSQPQVSPYSLGGKRLHITKCRETLANTPHENSIYGETGTYWCLATRTSHMEGPRIKIGVIFAITIYQ
jgi:hypothetical protein